MDGLAASYVERFAERITSFDEQLQGLPDEAVNWSPGPQMNSLAVLVTHIVGAVCYLLSDVVLGEPTGRVREAEFQVTGLSTEELRQRLAGLLDYVQGAVARIPTGDIAAERYSPQHNQNFTIAMAMLRALDHFCEHLGHAEMTRLLWEQRAKTTTK